MIMRHVDEVLVRSSTMGVNHAPFLSPGIPLKVENMLVLEYGNPQSLEVLTEHASDLAAVPVEPVQSRHPDLQATQGVPARIEEWTQKSEIALIFDEVITGFSSTLAALRRVQAGSGYLRQDHRWRYAGGVLAGRLHSWMLGRWDVALRR